VLEWVDEKKYGKDVELQIGNGSAPIFSMEYECNLYFESFVLFKS